MKFAIRFLSVMLIAVSLGGCATPLTSAQEREYQSYQDRGITVEEKNPRTGAALGLLPGGGSFYNREYRFGVINLLFWPYSILWDPVGGYDGSLSINYIATKADLKAKMDKEIRDLDDQLLLSTVTKEDYIRRKRDIETRYGAGN